MFKARFHLKISANHVSLTNHDGGAPVEARPARPFSYGDKLVADREALEDVMQSVFRRAAPNGLRRLVLSVTVDVETPALIGDDEAGVRAALKAVGATKINLLPTVRGR